MKKIIGLATVAILVLGAQFCYASASERLKATGEKIEGSVQEEVGDVTGDDELKAKGKTNKLKGSLRSTKEDVKDKLSD